MLATSKIELIVADTKVIGDESAERKKLIGPQALKTPPSSEAASFHIAALAVLVANKVACILASAVGTGKV